MRFGCTCATTLRGCAEARTCLFRVTNGRRANDSLAEARVGALSITAHSLSGNRPEGVAGARGVRCPPYGPPCTSEQPTSALLFAQGFPPHANLFSVVPSHRLHFGRNKVFAWKGGCLGPVKL